MIQEQPIVDYKLFGDLSTPYLLILRVYKYKNAISVDSNSVPIRVHHTVSINSKSVEIQVHHICGV
jgi:hypothetical protein